MMGRESRAPPTQQYWNEIVCLGVCTAPITEKPMQKPDRENAINLTLHKYQNTL